MGVSVTHLVRQVPSLWASLAMLAAGGQRELVVPGPEIEDQAGPRAPGLVSAYTRFCGGSTWPGQLPPHLFPQWGWPLITTALRGLPYDLKRAVNAGCNWTLHQLLPCDEPLHLRGRLARFTEETTEGWQLTATAVQRAAGSKKKTQQILDQLGKLHRGRLPKTVVEQVKAWGGYYGNASVGTLTLLEFRDQEALAELRQLPELHDLLQPFPAGNRALATVDKSNLTAVRQILTRLGVQITTL